MERDERDVLMILSCLRNWVPNLWQPDQKITNIATGKIATEEMTKNVLSVRERGKEAMDMFIKRFTTSEDDINNEKLSYYDPIKKQPMKLFNETVIKTKHTIPEDQGQSFAEILSIFDNRNLNLREIMEWPVTSKPWSICKEDSGSRSNQKSIFRNHLELMSPNPSTTIMPNDIHTSIVDAMRIVRLIPITDVKPRTFRCWSINVLKYLNSLPGTIIHIVFDKYQ